MGNVLKATDIRTVDGTDKNFLVLKKDVTFQENNVAGPTPLSHYSEVSGTFSPATSHVILTGHGWGLSDFSICPYTVVAA